MSTTICLAQSKGGTSKTSSTINIGAAMVQKGGRVLLVDLDQQSSMTISLGVDPASLRGRTTHELLSNPDVQIADIVVRNLDGLDLLPAHLDLADLEYTMRDSVGRERRLTRKLATVSNQYDYILIDTPPSFALTTLNGMTASDYLLVPVQPEPLCLYGLEQQMSKLQMIQDNANPNIRLLGIFITLYDSRIAGHKEITRQLKENWGEECFNTLIRRRANMLESTLKGRPVVATSPNSEIAQDYLALTQEIISHVQ